MVLRSWPRWRAIAEIVQPLARSACASTSSSRVSMRRGSFVSWWRSETVSFEGAPPRLVEPYGWGTSVSNSGEIHLSAVIGADDGGAAPVDDELVAVDGED